MALHQQRLLALIQSGAAVQIGSEAFPAAFFQPGSAAGGFYPAHLLPAATAHPLAIEAFTHLRPEEQAALLAAQQQGIPAGQLQQFLSPGMVPPIVMEQLVAQQQQQQQQQQQALVVSAAPNIISAHPPENVIEIQHQYQMLMHSIHKNPILAQSPQVKMALEHYQRVMQEHQIQQQRMLHEILMQSTQQQQQQQHHELQKQLLLARVPPGAPPTGEEGVGSSRGIRKGVIVHPNCTT